MAGLRRSSSSACPAPRAPSATRPRPAGPATPVSQVPTRAWPGPTAAGPARPAASGPAQARPPPTIAGCVQPTAGRVEGPARSQLRPASATRASILSRTLAGGAWSA
eukprot:2849288-Rhodomonas_salina.1